MIRTSSSRDFLHAGLSLALAALAPALVSAQELQQSQVLALEAGEARVVVLTQRGNADLVLHAQGSETSLRVNHPLYGGGIDLMLLGPFAQREELQLEVIGAERASDYSLQLRPIDAADPAVPALRALTQAGIAFDTNTPDAIAAAAAGYDSVPPQNFAGIDLEAYARYLHAALLYHKQYLPAEALQRLETMGDSCTMPDFCHRAQLLRLQIALDLQNSDAVIAELRALVRALQERAQTPAARADLAHAQALLGFGLIARDEAAAIEQLGVALELARSLGHVELQAEAHNYHATFYIRSRTARDMQKVVEHLESGVALLEQSGTDTRNLVALLTNLGQTYRELGDYELAQATADRTLPLVESSGDEYLVRGVYGQLGAFYLLLGDVTRAEHFANLAIDLDLRSGHAGNLSESRHLLGMVLRAKGDARGASALHEQSVDYYEQTQPNRRLAVMLNELAIDHLEAGDMARARQLFDQAYAQPVVGPELAANFDGIRNRARLLLGEGLARDALELLLPAVEGVNAGTGIVASEIELHRLLMQSYTALGDMPAAIAAGRQAIARAADIQGQLEYFRLGPAWSARTHGVFRELAGLLLARYYDSGDKSFVLDALEVSERSRAASLLQQRVAGNSGAQAESMETQQLRRTLTDLGRRRAAMNPDDPRLAELNQAYFRTLELYRATLGTGDALQNERRFDVRASLAALPQDTALVHYLCVPGANCHLIVGSGSELEAFPLMAADDLALLVGASLPELRSAAGNANPPLQRLARELLTPLAGHRILEGKSRLVTISDQPLGALPLAALPWPEDAGYLVDRFALTSIPSLQAFTETRARPAMPHSVDLAVLADPVFSEAALPPMIAAAEPLRGWVQKLEPLPWSRQEAESLRSIFGAEHSAVHVGSAANRSNLLSETTRNSRYLHIASHAYFNPAMPDLVGIALSAESQVDSEGDFISLSELMSHSFNVELVVISGCETGQGEYLAGEGYMSLARGFMAQGVDHVVSTLWPVSDRASAEFMRLFYEVLHSGAPVEAALRSAQIGLAANPRYRNPFYWAPYVLASLSK